MTDTSICRSSANCEEPATAGTFGHYFCAEHFAEIDLIRRTWFSPDGVPYRVARNPDDAGPSMSDVAGQIREIVAEAQPRPVRRAEIASVLGLPKAHVVQACHVAAATRLVMSTTNGYVLAGSRSVEQRAREIAAVVQASGEDYVTVTRVCNAIGMKVDSSNLSRAIRRAVAEGWIIDARRGRAGGFEAGPAKLPAAA